MKLLDEIEALRGKIVASDPETYSEAYLTGGIISADEAECFVRQFNAFPAMARALRAAAEYREKEEYQPDDGRRVGEWLDEVSRLRAALDAALKELEGKS